MVINIAIINKKFDKIRIQKPSSFFSDVIMFTPIKMKLTMIIIQCMFSFFIRFRVRFAMNGNAKKKFRFNEL